MTSLPQKKKKRNMDESYLEFENFFLLERVLTYDIHF